jgi:mono/diheme cytochrome c family protein
MTVHSRSRLDRTRRWLHVGGVAGSFVVLLAAAGSARTSSQAAQPAPNTAALVAQGEYLANRVAMCVQCHSPRDIEGNVILTRRFHGGAIPVLSPYSNRQFAAQAPNIAGLPGFTDDQIIALLTEGRATDRDPPRPPMPPFRMSRQDAQAIVAYLRTF